MIYRISLLFILNSIFFLQSIIAQPVTLSGSVSVSFHSHDFEAPLPWWDATGLIFPSAAFNAEFPMAFVGGPLATRLVFRTGLRYTRLASRVNWQFDVMDNEEPFTGKFKISQHYLAIPLHLKLNIGNTPVFVFAGPEFGFLIFARKVSDTLTPVEFRSSQSESVGKDINTFHLALGGGIGVQITSRLRSFVRYNAGLNDAKKDPERTVLDTDWSTKEIEFGMEFVFGGKKDP